jgi:subtilisin family serine protease
MANYRFASTFSVGAIDIEYNRWQGGYAGIKGSNYHKKLNIWAPGKLVYSAFINENDPKVTNKYEWASGTSMACPHVAGVMAIIMGYEGYTKIGAQDVYDRLNDNVIKAVNSDAELARVGATLNLFQTNIKGGTRRPGTQAPYDGVGHDELKFAVRSVTALQSQSTPNVASTKVPSSISATATSVTLTAISTVDVSATSSSVDPSISIDSKFLATRDKLPASFMTNFSYLNTPMPTQAPPNNDNEDMDEMIIVDDGTDPNDPNKTTPSTSKTSTVAPSSMKKE